MPVRARFRPLLGTAIAVAASLAPAAQPERPTGAQRVVRVFDFEEQATNPLPVPYGWVRAQHDPAVPRDREGFPIWNRAALDYTGPAFRGTGSVVVPVSGGSASLRLLSGVIGVFPGADYGVSVRVRTENMVHSRAALAARTLDQLGRPLGKTEVLSPLVRSEGEWSTLRVQVPGIDERAAYLQIELLVLQPRQQPGAERDHRPFRVWNEDYHARAWFDDLAVTLLPRLELTTGVPGHTVGAGAQPEIEVLIRDLTGERMRAVVEVLDADARPVDAFEMAPGQGRMLERFRPRLPAPGWYRAVLRVESAGRVIGVRALDFAWGAPEDEKRARPAGFALSAGAVEPAAAEALPTMARWAGVGAASVGVWDAALDRASAQPGVNPAFRAVRDLLDDGLTVAIALDESPHDLAALAGKDPWDVAGALAADESLWMPWAEQALDQFGQGVLQWQIGAHPGVWGGRWAELADGLRRVGSAVDKWVPGPELRAAWPMGDATPAALRAPGRGLVVRDDGAGEDAALADLVADWAAAAPAAGDAAPTLTIEFPASTDGRVSRAALGKLARRLVTAWAAARRANVSDRVGFALVEPWRSSGGLRPHMMPTPELAAWRTLASVLGAGRPDAPVRDLDLLPGVRTVLAGEGDEGVLIAWLTDPEAPLPVLEMPLHPGPVRRVDLLGERRALAPTQDSGIGAVGHRVELSREPVVIEGVRAELVRFLAGLRLDPGRFNPTLGQRRHALVIENPWDFPVRGRIFIVEPGGMSGGAAGRDRSWQLTPRVIPFALNANERREEPIEIAFGAGQEAGWTEVVFDVQLTADEEYPLLRVSRRMEVASEDLELEVVAYRAEGGAVSVHAVVTNRSGDPRSVELAAVAMGSSRERATINGLARGETGERRFLMFGLAPGARISVGLTEPKTGVRLTRTITAP